MTDTVQETSAAIRADSKNPYLIPAAIVLAGILVAFAILFRGSGSFSQTISLGGDDSKSGAIAQTGTEIQGRVLPITDRDHVYGSRDADVFIIEYSDYQCPFCTRFHETIMKVLEQYNGRVAWVYRHLPLESIHPEARPAALAGECIAEQKGDEGFFTFTNSVFEENLPLSRDTYLSLAKKIGVDEAAFASCLDSGKYDTVVDEHMTNAEEIGGTGTPFNVLLTRKGDIIKFSGAQPIERVDTFVQRALNSLNPVE